MSAGASPIFQPARYTRRGDLIFTGGVVDVDESGEIQNAGDVTAQTRAIFRTIEKILASQGGSMRDIVTIDSYHADMREADLVFEVGREVFPDEPPAWTPSGHMGTHVPGALVMIRAVAHVGPEEKQVIFPENQPWLRRFPTSAGVRKGDYVFVAGQSAADEQGQVASPFTHVDQARAAYARMLEVLEAAGADFSDVLDFTSYHVDIRGGISTLEDVWRPEVMKGVSVSNASSASHVGTTALLAPEMLGVYTAVADLSEGGRVGSTPDFITWNQSPPEGGHGDGGYPLAAAAKKEKGKLITVAGQVPSGPDGDPIHVGDPEAQTRFIFEQIRATLEGFGADLTDLVEVRSFHKEPRTWPIVQRVAREFFPLGQEPAWTFVGSTGLWREPYQAEIAAIAVVD